MSILKKIAAFIRRMFGQNPSPKVGKLDFSDPDQSNLQ